MADDQKLLPPSGIATTQQPQQPKRKGTGFTNLSRILQASKGSKLGQTIAGGISGQAQQVQSGIQSAQQKFKEEAEANRVGTAQDEANRRSIIETASSGGDVSSNVGTFRRYLSGEYKGPMELANQQQLANQAQQAESLGTLASGVGSRSKTGEGDRQELLRRFAGGADYTSGQRKLDESILARDPGANLAGVARQTKGVAEQAQRAGAVAQQEAQQYQNLAKIFAKKTAEELETAKQPISSELDARVAAAAAKEDQRKNFLQNVQNYMNTNEYQDLPENKQEAILMKKDPSKTKEDILKGYLSQLGPAVEGQQNLGLLSQEDIDSLTGPQGFLSGISSDLKKSEELKKYYDSISFISGAIRSRENREVQAKRAQLAEYSKNLKNSNLINQIISTLAPGAAGTDVLAQNVTRSGLADQDIVAKLNALSSLQGQDLEFSENQPRYKAGNISLAGTVATQKNVAQNKVDHIKNQIDNLKKTYKYVSGAKDPSYARRAATKLKEYDDYLKQAEAELDNIKNIEDTQLKNE